MRFKKICASGNQPRSPSLVGSMLQRTLEKEQGPEACGVKSLLGDFLARLRFREAQALQGSASTREAK